MSLENLQHGEEAIHNDGPGADAAAEVRTLHVRLKREFEERTRHLGLGDLPPYFWYHTIDLGNGLLTPGTYDFRNDLAGYGLEENLHGWKVLDVGPATGFFSFEFERRGADVTALEVPSLAELDRFPGETTEDFLAKMQAAFSHHTVFTPAEIHHLFHECTQEQFYHLFLDGPFMFCHKVLNSRVRRTYGTIYDLAQLFGTGSFDLVFLGDVLLHTIDPLGALASAASVARKSLVLAQNMSTDPALGPIMEYVGGPRANEGITWWYPNYRCLEQLLRKLGFRDVYIAGRNSFCVRPNGHRYDSVTIHAHR